jgi:hypothetical protein
MKTKILFALAFISICAVTFESCKTYTEGPSLSFRSKKARVCNTWKIDKCYVGGNDQTASMIASLGDYRLEIKKDMTYTVSGNYPESGTWKLGEDYDDIFFTPTGGALSSARLLKLKNKEMWYKTTASNGVFTEFHFVSAK